MKHMHAPEIQVCHILRPRIIFFCVWLDDAIPTEDMWKIIMEDKLYDYSSEQDTSNNDVIVASEISVNTLNGVQATEGDLTASSNED